MHRSIKTLALWLSMCLTVAAGVSLVWPVNSTYLSGDCVGARHRDGSCPVRWDQVDVGTIPSAVIITSVLVVATSLPLWFRRRSWRWFSYGIAFVPLVVLGAMGTLVFGPVYLPALAALLLSAVWRGPPPEPEP